MLCLFRYSPYSLSFLNLTPFVLLQTLLIALSLVFSAILSFCSHHLIFLHSEQLKADIRGVHFRSSTFSSSLSHIIQNTPTTVILILIFLNTSARTFNRIHQHVLSAEYISTYFQQNTSARTFNRIHQRVLSTEYISAYFQQNTSARIFNRRHQHVLSTEYSSTYFQQNTPVMSHSK